MSHRGGRTIRAQIDIRILDIRKTQIDPDPDPDGKTAGKLLHLRLRRATFVWYQSGPFRALSVDVEG
jgi:hypothetical protein